jgi:hypothetical protein
MEGLLLAIAGILGGFETNLIASRFEENSKNKKFEKYLKEKLPQEINQRLRALTSKYTHIELDDFEKIWRFLISNDSTRDLIEFSKSVPSPQQLKAYLEPIASKCLNLKQNDENSL